MWRGFMAGAGLCGVLAVLLGVAYPALGDPGGPSFTAAAKPISMVPISQAFRLDLGKVGPFNSPYGPKSIFVFLAPASAGVAITQLSSPEINGNATDDYHILARVNGFSVFRGVVGLTKSNAGAVVVNLEPPIVIPPNGKFEIGMWIENPSANPSQYARLTIGGYCLTLEDLGWR